MDEKEKEVMEEILEELEEASAKKNKKGKPETPVKGAAPPGKTSGEPGKGVKVDVQIGPEADGEMPAEEIPEDTQEAEAPQGGKKGVFSRKGKKDPSKEKIDKLTEEIEELKDRDLRRQAEFDNFRKRTEKEKSQQFDAGAAHILEKILPVIDNFERGFTMVEETDKEDAFVDGMNKVYKQLMTELEKAGVKPIEAVGKEFDPNLHNAVMQVDTGEVESGFVAQEMQKGYMYHDTVLRFSMVAVQE